MPSRPSDLSPAPQATRGKLERRLNRLWFEPHGASDRLLACLLWPAERLVAQIAAARRRRITARKGLPRRPGLPPVVVVGNFVVGGTGKTPLLIALVQALGHRGWRPGVLARGYRSAGGQAAMVDLDAGADPAASFGDEPVLIAQRCGRPVAVGADRGAALGLLLRSADCDVVLSDDGLQHEGLPRSLQLAVFDARGAGSGRCLPSGPLREPLAGLGSMDAVVLNGVDARDPRGGSDIPGGLDGPGGLESSGAGAHASGAPAKVFRFDIVPTAFVGLGDARRWRPDDFAADTRSRTVTAIAGIGSPQRFFATLATLGVAATNHPLADHVQLDAGWIAALPGDWIVMTEKDAVKCRDLPPAVRQRCVALQVDAVPEPALLDWLEERLRGQPSA